MRIGINLLYLIPGALGGSETYGLSLLQALAEIDPLNEYVVFVGTEAEGVALPDSPRMEKVVCPVSVSSRAGRYLWEQLRLPRAVRDRRIEILHSPGYVMPLAPPCRAVVSILDIVYRYPGAFPFWKKQILRILVRLSATRADHIITLSEASKREIVRELRQPPDKVTVTWLAPRPRRSGAGPEAWATLESSLGIRGPFLLAFSSLSPSKNIPRLLEAFAAIRWEEPPSPQLVLVGHSPRRSAPLEAWIARLGLEGRAIATGYLRDDSVALLLARSSGLVFPSLYEGFGLPVLEAMAADVPVACSTAASLPEVAGDAALFFDPTRPDDIATAMRRLVTDEDLRQRLRRRGRRNLARFSWRETAARTLAVYRSLAGIPGAQ